MRRDNKLHIPERFGMMSTDPKQRHTNILPVNNIFVNWYICLCMCLELHFRASKWFSFRRSDMHATDRSDNFLCFPLCWFACRPWLRLKTSWGWQPRVTTMVIVLPTFLVMVLMLRQMSFSFLPSSLQCHTLLDAINSVERCNPNPNGSKLQKLCSVQECM